MYQLAKKADRNPLDPPLPHQKCRHAPDHAVDADITVEAEANTILSCFATVHSLTPFLLVIANGKQNYSQNTQDDADGISQIQVFDLLQIVVAQTDRDDIIPKSKKGIATQTDINRPPLAISG